MANNYYKTLSINTLIQSELLLALVWLKNTYNIVPPVTENSGDVVGSVEDGAVAGAQRLSGLFFHDLCEADAEIIHQLLLQSQETELSPRTWQRAVPFWEKDGGEVQKQVLTRRIKSEDEFLSIPVMTSRRVMKVSAQSGALSSSTSVMSLYWELHAPSVDSMASTFSTATRGQHTQLNSSSKLKSSRDPSMQHLDSLFLSTLSHFWNTVSSSSMCKTPG